jgi:hypothetical protein
LQEEVAALLKQAEQADNRESADDYSIPEELKRRQAGTCYRLIAHEGATPCIEGTAL